MGEEILIGYREIKGIDARREECLLEKLMDARYALLVPLFESPHMVVEKRAIP